MFFHTIKQKIAKFMQRMFCRHDYSVTSVGAAAPTSQLDEAESDIS